MDNQTELEPWLYLIHAQRAAPAGVGKHLRAHWPGKSLADLAPEELFQLLSAMLENLRGYGRCGAVRDPSGHPAKISARQLNRDLAWLEGGPNRYLLPFTDSRYPPLLREIPDPPLALYVAGIPGNLSGPCLSVVGARNPTPQGRDIARTFSRALADTGLTIVSGLARGIDGSAHLGALEAGITVAVCAHGLDRIYPAAHRALAARVAAAGALISEFPPGTPPRRHHFPMRNRLISGMSLGTLVVEAGPRSGSLITARLAAEQNREVFAVPGSINSPRSKGCHELLKEGAALAESVEDILAGIGRCENGQRNITPVEVEADERSSGRSSFLEQMGFAPCTRDELVKRSGLTSAEVSSMLLGLELDGCVELCPGGTYVRVNRS